MSRARIVTREGSRRPFLPHGIRAMPGLLRVGFAEVVAYRAEFAIWILVGLLPLIMLALMHTVAREAPIGGFGPRDVSTYYLAVMLTRMTTGSWVLWELHEDVRLGTLSLRLLRPLHPLAAYAAENLAAIPLRGLLAIPFAAILLALADPALASAARIAMFLASLAGAWAVTFLLLACVACGVFWFDRVLSLWELYLGLYSVLSGFVLPIALLPPWLQGLTRWLPFRAQIAVPVEILLGRAEGAAALRGLGLQAGWIVILGGLFAWAWRRGLRRYEAFGG